MNSRETRDVQLSLRISINIRNFVDIIVQCVTDKLNTRSN